MRDIIPEQLQALARLVSPLYVVGGTCRDYLAGLSGGTYDFDICAPHPAEQIVAAAVKCGFQVCSVYKNTGTVKLKCGGEEYEYAAFRSDGYVRGTHVPAKTFFTDDIRTDALRRDFKMNAVYYDIAAEKFVDPLGGMADIAQKRVSTVREADRVFGEDGLRLMRLARQAASAGFTPSEECAEGARLNSSLIADISAERIWAELNAILHADGKYGKEYAQYNGLKILQDTGVLARVLPELCLGDGMAQRDDFHSHDVLEHSLRCVKYSDGSVRLAALLHDVGKPYCKLQTGVFYGHEKEGARIARDICARLKVSKRLAEETEELVLLHMYDANCGARAGKVRKFIVNHYGVMDKLFLLKQADYSACKDDLSEAPAVAKWKGVLREMEKEGAPLTLKQLSVNGNDLIGAGICPNEVGNILHRLLEECALNGRLNKRETLLALAQRLV